MTDRTSCALVRLGALAALALLAAFLACRPAWSPDGRKLLFPVQLPGPRFAIALYDRDAGTTQIVFTADGEHMATPLWTPDGKGAVIVSASPKEKKICVTTLAMAPSGARKTVEIESASTGYSSLVVPAAIVGRRLFLSANGIARVDLDTGEVKRREPAKAGRELVVTARGDGLCYVSLGKGKDETDWELGTVDPETLQLTPLLQAPADRRWKVVPIPAFSRDQRRVALLALDVTKGEDQSILVFADGKVEAVLPLGPQTEVGCGSVDWAPDGATLLVSLCRREPLGDRLDTWCLWETTISGSVSRETTIVAAGSDRDREVHGMLMPLALSPDGRTAAFSTAMLEHLDEDQHGLWLVDLAHRDRKVTRVPFPPAAR